MSLNHSIPKSPLKYLLYVSREHAVSMWLATISAVLAVGVDALDPYLYRHIVDSFTAAGETGSYADAWFWIGAYLVVFAASLALWHCVGVFGGRWTSWVRVTSRKILTEHLLGHSHNYFEERFAGSVANKIAHASDGVRDLAEVWFYNIIQFVVSFVVSIALVFTTDWRIGLIFIVWLLIALPLNYILARRRIPITMEAQNLETEIRGVTVDVVTNVRAVQEYGDGAREVGQLMPLMLNRRAAGYRNWMYGRYVVLINGLLQLVFFGAILIIAALQVSEGAMSVGTIVLLLTLLLSVGMKIFQIGWAMSSIAETWGEIAEGLREILVPHEITDDEDVHTDEAVRGDVAFHDVTFSYDGGVGTPVLADFTLTLKEGERVGFVGRSGAGKSTLVKLLLRHYDVTRGSVTLGEKDITSLPLSILRGSIAVIPQESHLFHRTLRENIAYGRPGATEAEVIQAAKLAEAHDFIMSLPEGYDTLVGERGVKLSGGQRQRVAIARAILKNAPVLVLDEATSALDSESEVAIQKALHELMEGKTVIAIAHRLSTLREMDRIIVLEGGKIVEEGNHDALVARGGIYARLWEHQAGGFLQE